MICVLMCVYIAKLVVLYCLVCSGFCVSCLCVQYLYAMAKRFPTSAPSRSKEREREREGEGGSTFLTPHRPNVHSRALKGYTKCMCDNKHMLMHSSSYLLNEDIWLDLHYIVTNQWLHSI